MRIENDKNRQQNIQKHYEGVYPATRKNGEVYFRASLTYRRKHISLGSYPTPESAHQAYLEGCRLIDNSSLGIIEYHSSSSLSFEKWVCLINFRDNDIYFT